MWSNFLIVAGAAAYIILPLMLKSKDSYKIAGICIGTGVLLMHIMHLDGVFLILKTILMLMGFVLIRLIAMEPSTDEER